MENIVKVSSPCFAKFLRSIICVFGGYTFLAESGKKFALYQIFDVIGGATNFCEIRVRWKIFLFKEDNTLEDLTCNGLGIKNDGSYFRKDLESKGLTAKEVESMMQHSGEIDTSSKDAEITIATELNPIIKEKVSAIQKTMVELDKLNETELVTFTQEVRDLLLQVKEFYPRSYEKLLDIKLEIRKQYAKLKYPELYLELEKLHRDKEYKVDSNDNIAGFGPQLISEGVFHRYFVSKGEDMKHWELGSPFEEKFGKSLFFNS